MICVARFQVALEVLLQHHHHELHRRVVVVQHHHLVHARRLGLCRLALDHHGALPVVRARRGRGGRWGLGLLLGHDSFYRLDASLVAPQPTPFAECAYCTEGMKIKRRRGRRPARVPSRRPGRQGCARRAVMLVVWSRPTESGDSHAPSRNQEKGACEGRVPHAHASHTGAGSPAESAHAATSGRCGGAHLGAAAAYLDRQPAGRGRYGRRHVPGAGGRVSDAAWAEGGGGQGFGAAARRARSRRLDTG